MGLIFYYNPYLYHNDQYKIYFGTGSVLVYQSRLSLKSILLSYNLQSIVKFTYQNTINVLSTCLCMTNM